MHPPHGEHLHRCFETEELNGFSRSMADLHWLLLILVLAYFFIPTGPLTSPDAVILSMVAYTVFVLVFRYLNIHARNTRLKLAIETWAMVIFITVILQHTGHIESPLINLYLLVIIASAITLGKAMTALEVLLIVSCFFLTGYQQFSGELFTAQTITRLAAQFSPFLLVAGVTSMLTSDILAAKRKASLLSQTDELTGLLNLRAFNTIFRHEIARATSHHEPLTLIMIDLDGLRQINDLYGHATGNRMIQAVAQALQSCVRTPDVLARHDGDEFVVLMPRTGPDAAHTCAERIRNTITNTTLSTRGQCLAPTASIGVASYPDGVDEPAAVLDKADLALCNSKECGRNRVTNYVRELEITTACA
ncbi:MAG: GGDEF domain-containing protein [Gammaproteobacteria bacterium]|jgi:diguanylate cyclase (GGDEF)-like protein